MEKRHVMCLTDQERNELENVVEKLEGTRQRVRRTQICRKAYAYGPNWTDQQIAEAFPVEPAQ